MFKTGILPFIATVLMGSVCSESGSEPDSDPEPVKPVPSTSKKASKKASKTKPTKAEKASIALKRIHDAEDKLQKLIDQNADDIALERQRTDCQKLKRKADKAAKEAQTDAQTAVNAKGSPQLVGTVDKGAKSGNAADGSEDEEEEKNEDITVEQRRTVAVFIEKEGKPNQLTYNVYGVYTAGSQLRICIALRDHPTSLSYKREIHHMVGLDGKTIITKAELPEIAPPPSPPRKSKGSGKSKTQSQLQLELDDRAAARAHEDKMQERQHAHEIQKIQMELNARLNASQ